jgi:DNA-damage-inducible protein D
MPFDQDKHLGENVSGNRPQLTGGLAILEKMLYELHDTQVRVGKVELVQQWQGEQQAKIEARVGTLEGDHEYVSALGYARLHPPLSTERVYLAKVGKVATRIAAERGIRIGSTKHPTFGRVNTYPERILRDAFGEVNRR